MRKLRIFEHISLDGVIQNGGDQDGDFPYGDWKAPYRSPAGAQAVAEAQGDRFDFLLGRRTYDLWSSFWPKIRGGPFADAMNAATKYVATHRPDGLEWGPVETLGADVVEGVRRVKSTDGPDLIVFGSSTLTSVLLDQQGLVDDVVLMVYPVLLGRGKLLLRPRQRARARARQHEGHPDGRAHQHVPARWLGASRILSALTRHPPGEASRTLKLTSDLWPNKSLQGTPGCA